MNHPQPFEIYRHFKGNLYQVIAVAEHSESGEELVIYQALYGDYRIYARPLSMFMEKSDKAKYPEAAQQYRFERQERGSISRKEVLPEAEPEKNPLDPMVLSFLDADSYEERLNILIGIQHRITDDIINVMAMCCDLEIREGDVEARCEELKRCLLKMEKFECNRLR